MENQLSSVSNLTGNTSANTSRIRQEHNRNSGLTSFIPSAASHSYCQSQNDFPELSAIGNDGIYEEEIVEHDNRPSDTTTEEIILAVVWRRGMLGAAYYSIETSEVNLLTDLVDVNPEFNMWSNLYQQVQPSKIVTVGCMPEKFMVATRRLLCQEVSEDDSTGTHNHLHILPSRDCKFESCKRRILSLKLPTEPEECDEDEHLLYLYSFINMNAESMVIAFGALLKYLDKAWVHYNLSNTHTAAPILIINTISLNDIVTVDAETYEALQIFSQQSHPSNFKMWAPGSSKEGLSLFGIFNKCKSKLGSKFMKTMFLHPTRNLDVLNARLRVLQFCLVPSNEQMVKNMLDCLKHIKSITLIVTKLSTAQASITQWKSLHRTIYNSILIAELCGNWRNEAPLFQKISDCLLPDLYQVTHCINRIVDFDSAEAQHKFVVRLGIDEELDRKKQQYGGLPELMSSLAEMELKDLPTYVTVCSVIYIPEIGYLVALPFWKDVMDAEDFIIPGFDFMFRVGTVAHYKSARCREMDLVLGDCLLQISEHESRIMLRLTQFIMEHLSPLHEIVKLSAELDCLISLSIVAHENSYVCPTLTQDRVLEIKEGRHPLQELCVSSYVPNDTFSSDEHGLMKILTGPNASGKSVYLKQVALIVYLAHIGSFVPAKSATIGMLNHIHTRIQTIESIASRLSAFMIDLKQMSLALYCSTAASLIIIDEFGKGTNEVDGLALLTSSLKHFLERQELCPHVFVATHFHHVTQLLPVSQYLTLQTLEYILDRDEQIVYLYKLKKGNVQTSLAFKVAESVGISRPIIARSEQALEAFRTGHNLQKVTNSKMTIKMQKYLKVAKKCLLMEVNEENATVLSSSLKDLPK